MNLRQHRKAEQKLVLGLTFLLALAGCGRNGGGISSGTGGLPAPASSPAEISSSSEVVKVTVAPVRVASGGSAEASIKLAILSGYHVNANPATYPYLIATEVTLEKTEGIAPGKPSYPPAKKQQFQFAEEALAVYEGEIQITLPLRADPQTPPGSRSLPLTVRVQACDHEKCFPPASINATLPVEVN